MRKVRRRYEGCSYELTQIIYPRMGAKFALLFILSPCIASIDTYLFLTWQELDRKLTRSWQEDDTKVVGIPVLFLTQKIYYHINHKCCYCYISFCFIIFDGRFYNCWYKTCCQMQHLVNGFILWFVIKNCIYTL